MKRVEGKVALVTGAAAGIGRATAIRLAENGAKVAVTDLNPAGSAVVDEITANGGTAKFWQLDSTDEAAIEKVFADVAATFGKLDVLVNNAGISGVNKPTHELSSAEWDQVINVNLRGVFLCTKYAIPFMLKNGSGSIINLSSIYGLIGAADIPPYHAAKGAVRLMSKNDALTYAKQNIRVNSVHPGFIWTPLVDEFSHRGGDAAAARAHLESLHPVGHLGEPDDIAYGILYLASDESKFVTGSELVIDGGYTAQ